MPEDAADHAASQMEALSRAFARNEETLRERRVEVERLRGTLAEYEELQGTLRTLPERVEHEVMVPLGKLALFPGQLRHTNEIMVLLGDNYFALRSASQAAAISERRAEALRPQIGAAGHGRSRQRSRRRRRSQYCAGDGHANLDPTLPWPPTSPLALTRTLSPSLAARSLRRVRVRRDPSPKPPPSASASAWPDNEIEELQLRQKELRYIHALHEEQARGRVRVGVRGKGRGRGRVRARAGVWARVWVRVRVAA